MTRTEPLPRWAIVFVVVVAIGGLGVVACNALVDRLDDGEPADWRVSPDAALDADSTEIPIDVRERECASARPADGRIVVDVAANASTVVIDVRVRPLGGDQECPSNPITPYVVELDEPLGDREIVGERWTP